jgi:hypothetical protein
MNPSKNTSKQPGIKKSVITIAAALVLIVVAYFGYTLLASRVNPCESLFERTTIRVQKKIGSIKTEGKSFLDDAQIQKLSSQSQQAALDLKTCCIFFHEEKISFDEFLKCQDDFKKFETAIARVSDLMAEIQKATQEKKTKLAAYKLEQIHQTLNGLDKLATTLQEQIHLYTQRSPDMKAKQSSLSQPAILTEAEPNDTYNQATKISMGKITGELGEDDQTDYFQFDVPSGSILNVDFTPDENGESMKISLLNPERTEIWYSDKITAGVMKSKRVMMNTLSGGRYYLAAFDGRGLYTFEIRTESQNDADCGSDAGDKITEAIETKPGLSFSGELGGLDEEDWYQVQIPDGHVLEFAFTPAPESNRLKFSLLNDERKEVWRSGELTPGVTESDRLLMNTTSGGTYFLKSFYGDGIYRIDLYTKSQNDAETGTDAGDRITKALKIKSGRSFVGELGGLDEEDWYTFEPQKVEKLNFTCDPEGEPMKLALRTLEQREAGYSAEIFPGVTKSLEIPEDIKPPYFIRISGGRGKYSIELR